MSPATDQLAYAVMEDDTVLCADCLPEACDQRQPASAATTVHAWLAPGHDHSCSWCGINAEITTDER
jgi:hypothetical protein